MRKHSARPFTLIELIAVMSVMIILAAVAIPAYSSLFEGRKTTLAANMLNGAVMEARAHAVSSKSYTALVFVKDSNSDNGYRSFRIAEVYHDPELENSSYIWRRWVPGSAPGILPENTMIPATNDDLGTTSGKDGNKATSKMPTTITNLGNSGLAVTTNVPAIIFKPNGQLSGTGDDNVVVRFVEVNRYTSNPGGTPKLPLNINWLTCKTKFLDPVLQ